ncbi:transposase [Tessaracoccus rhinocerotis]|uniref:Transposase n=1 Tax=Tessaracoccus rhinocerotis TaxID=1689449 RepID=A0A553K3W8_9ACTN|nr:transposase [Tessaracoccus rhinocerotis]
MKVIGVDEHCWRHTRHGDKFVTVVIDLTPVRDDTGRSRLLDMVEGRSKEVFKSWLEAQTPEFRAGVEIVAMDGFSGYKSATTEAVPDATTVMDPFHVVALAGDKLNQTRQRVQRELTGGRGRKNDPLYKARRLLQTGIGLLTGRQNTRLDALFDVEDHDEVEVTWGVYQNIIAAYRDKNRAAGRAALSKLIDSIKAGVPNGWPNSLSSAGPCTSDVMTSWRSSTIPVPATDPRKRSMAVSNTSAASLSGSGTRPTTDSGHSSKQADSDPNSTHICEEPSRSRNVSRAGDEQLQRGQPQGRFQHSQRFLSSDAISPLMSAAERITVRAIPPSTELTTVRATRARMLQSRVVPITFIPVMVSNIAPATAGAVRRRHSNPTMAVLCIREVPKAR